MKLNSRRPLTLCFFVCLGIILGIIVFVQCTFKTTDVKFPIPKELQLREQVDYVIDDRTLTATLKIPQELDNDFVLTVQTFYQSLEISVNGETLYSQGNNQQTAFGTQFGKIINRVKIKRDLAGETLNIVAVTGNPYVEVSPLDITTEKSVDSPMFLVTRNILTFIFSAFAVLLGVVFIVLAILLKSREKTVNVRSFVALGGFVILTGIWVFSDSDLVQFLPLSTPTTFLISFSSLMLLPVPLLAYMDEVCTKRRKSLTVLSYLFLTNCMISLALYIFVGIEFSVSILLCHALILISIGFVCFIAYKEVGKRKNRDFKEVIVGIAVLSLTGLIAIIMFYFADLQIYADLFQFGMAIFIALLCINMWYRSVEVISVNSQVETYKTMAYIDGMTNLLNRSALDRDIDEIKMNLDHFRTLSFIVLDLNNLKKTNDSKGHAEGDRIIVSLAKCLQNAVDGIGNAYRVGGDEFVVIALNQTEEAINGMLDDIDARIEAFNTFDETKISVAKGVAFKNVSGTTMQEIMELLKQADNSMYVSKVSMHQEKDKSVLMPEDIQLEELARKVEDNINKSSILIVDDSDVNRVILSGIFSEVFRILEASDGWKALDIICSQRDHLSAILLDIMMPNVDGFEVLESLQASGLTEIIPIIVITSLDDPQAMKRVLDLGAFDIIVKPFDTSVVFSRVIHAIEYTWYKLGKGI